MDAINWSDAYLRENFADVQLDGVEFAKKETRVADQREMTLGEFLEKYNTSDIYTVSSLPDKMQRQVKLPPFLNCGGFDNYMESAIMWFSSGGTKSVIHNDGQDNVNCVLSGTKVGIHTSLLLFFLFLFFHPESDISPVCL
jgi:lysine-specific demethylase 8